MPHPKEILEACKKQLEGDYPSSEYKYLFEQMIPGNYYPDIQIRKDGKLVCVCEIGYTGAAKIKAYREMNISDIRWYSKNLDLVIQTGDYDGDLDELKKESLQRIKDFEEESKGMIKLEAEREIRMRKMVGESKLEEIIKLNIAKRLRERQSKIDELLDRDPYFLPLHWDCWFCDEDRVNGRLTPEEIEELGGAEYLYFTEQGYQCFYECDFNENHETSEGPNTWDDDCGPHYNGFEELLERYIRYYLEIDKK